VPTGRDIQHCSLPASLPRIDHGAKGRLAHLPPPHDRITGLASAVELAANTSYYLVAQEAAGGDQWWDYTCGVTTTSAVTVNSGVCCYGGGWVPYGSSGQCYGPVSLNYLEPGAPVGENFQHDLDGNLVRDGRWTYAWDAENRLVKMQSFANAPTGSRRRLEFAYDHQGRRIWKKVTNLDAPTVTSERKFLYDGWNPIAELDGAGAVLSKYVWGQDLSGSFQGAGGVGGLLQIEDTALVSHFCAYDGNGNIVGLVKSDGSISAQYEYGPFGEVIRATGPMAKANPFRFSTKYQDDETDLLYYGYRYYNASTGRWVSRDPLGDENVFAAHVGTMSTSGMLMLWQQALLPPYLFVLNDSVGNFDVRGLWVARTKPPPAHITTIVCKGGKAVPRLGPDTEANSRCVNRCIISHERQHAEEASAQNACAGKPDDVAVATSTPAERVSSEIKAYERQMKCLRLAIQGASRPDKHGKYKDDCTCKLGNVLPYIEEVPKRLSAWKNADPNDTKTWPQDEL
jgi:RHS repeat-associated protein